MGRRSRSRSPIRSANRSYSKPSNARSTVNMLDPASVELARNPGGGERKNLSERITCTIPGSARDRGRVADRLSGGGFGDGGRIVSVRGGGGERSGGFSRARGRDIHSRLSRSDGPNPRETAPDEDYRKNGSFRESDNKPVQRLVDPTFVPKSRAFFDHDDRSGGDSKWRGRQPYDPRLDFGSRHDRRDRPSWDKFGDRRDRRSFEHGRDERRSQPERRSFGGRGGFRDDGFDRSRADGVWAHDKFLELENDPEPKKEGIEVVIDQKKSSHRKVESD